MWVVLAIAAEGAGVPVGPAPVDLFDLARAPAGGLGPVPPLACGPAAPGIERCAWPAGPEPRRVLGHGLGRALPAPPRLGARWSPSARLAAVDPSADTGPLGAAAAELAVRVAYRPAEPGATAVGDPARVLVGRLDGTLPLALAPGPSAARAPGPALAAVRFPSGLPAADPRAGGRVRVLGALPPPSAEPPAVLGELVLDPLTRRVRLPAGGGADTRLSLAAPLALATLGAWRPGEPLVAR